MSKHHYENHPHEDASHAHDAAREHGQPEHVAGSEQPRQAHEQNGAQQQQQTHPTMTGHGITPFSHSDIEKLAHELWEARGCPEGSPEEDWFRAAQELRLRARTAR
jgi:hypothetical protein